MGVSFDETFDKTVENVNVGIAKVKAIMESKSGDRTPERLLELTSLLHAIGSFVMWDSDQ